MGDILSTITDKTGLPGFASLLLTLIVGLFMYLYLSQQSGSFLGLGAFKSKLKELVTQGQSGSIWSILNLALEEILEIKVSVETAAKETEALLKMPTPMLRSTLRQGGMLTGRGGELADMEPEKLKAELGKRLDTLRSLEKKVQASPDRNGAAIVGMKSDERAALVESLEASRLTSSLMGRAKTKQLGQAVGLIKRTFDDIGAEIPSVYSQEKVRRADFKRHSRVTKGILGRLKG